MGVHQPAASVNSLTGGIGPALMGGGTTGSGSGSTNNSLNLQATTSSSQHNTPAATLAITQGNCQIKSFLCGNYQSSEIPNNNNNNTTKYGNNNNSISSNASNKKQLLLNSSASELALFAFDCNAIKRRDSLVLLKAAERRKNSSPLSEFDSAIGMCGGGGYSQMTRSSRASQSSALELSDNYL